MKKKIDKNTSSARRLNFANSASRKDGDKSIAVQPGVRVNYNDRYLLDTPKWESDDTEEMLDLIRGARSKFE